MLGNEPIGGSEIRTESRHTLGGVREPELRTGLGSGPEFVSRSENPKL